ncbi:MAG: radical SAM protein [Promethearchaeia archaeon]
MNKKYIENNKITNEFIESYTKSNYRIIGKENHSAIKPCHWLKQKLLTGRKNRNCYKEIFGVESHRCLQNTPSLAFCNHQCVFCWRDVESGSISNEFLVEPDKPEYLVEEMLRHQKNLIRNHLPLKRFLDNYEIMIDIVHCMLINEGKHNISSLSKSIHVSKTKINRALNLLKNQNFLKPVDQNYNFYVLDEDIVHCISDRKEVELLINRELTSPDEIMQAHSEAMRPNHAAISLDGEPFLYPYISDLVREFRNRKMTTFIVTNGTLPERIEEMESYPSQLYISLPAANERQYKKVCRPKVRDGWDKIMNTLELVETLPCRTLVRLTAVKNLNIKESDIKEYAKVIERANPDFFEIKGFTLQAKALRINKRLKTEHAANYYFPVYEELKNFAQKFEEVSNFPLIYENQVSRDFLYAVNWDEDKDPKITKI